MKQPVTLPTPACDLRKSTVMKPLWLCVWSFGMSLTWLLPNHYPPWPASHMDAWAAIMLALAAVSVICRSTAKSSYKGVPLVVAGMCLIVAVQYAAGMIYFAGTAWISIAYMSGFALAVVIGRMWEASTPGQLGDALFLAVVVASVISVGLQFYGWFGLEGLGVWSMNLATGRPYANFGQPNQLATFLLWGVLGLVWAKKRGYIGPVIATLSSAYLLFGVALTGSRTAWVAVALLALGSWYWRKFLWGQKRSYWVAISLGLYFTVCCWCVGWVNELLQLSMMDPFERGLMTTGRRAEIWSALVNAALTRPMLGFGWNQVTSIQFNHTDPTLALNNVFAHSHNLVLDFALWAGIPFAFVVAVFFARWLFTHLSQAFSAEKALLLMVVVVTANHAMLELPLHYAYFLLPLGLVMGAVDEHSTRVKDQRPNFVRRSRILTSVIWSLAILVLVLVVRDYRKIERSYEQLRFRQVNPDLYPPPEIPHLLLLTQWQGFFWLTNFEPTSTVTDAQLTQMLELTNIFPSAGSAQKTATALVERGRQSEAKSMLIRACRVNSASQCEALRAAWAHQAKQNKKIAFNHWP